MARVVAIPGGGVRVLPSRARTRAAQRRSAGLSGRAGEPFPGRGLSFGSIFRGAVKLGASLIPGGSTALDIGRGLVGGGGSAPVNTCAPGFRRDSSGTCVREGIIGGFQRAFPGGQTGTQRDVMGEAVVGSFGLPAIVPSEVGTITRNDGTVSPIRRCPRRMVLGTDDLCYPKAILSRRSKFRKHRLPVRPPVTGADKRAIRTAARVKDDVRQLAMEVGWKCSKK